MPFTGVLLRGRRKKYNTINKSNRLSKTNSNSIQCCISLIIFITINMKLSALILLFPCAVFLTETALVIPVVPAVTKSCSVKKQCSKAPVKQTACSKKKACNKTPAPKKCNDDNPKCISCPVCYVFTFQPQYEWKAEYFIAKKNYSHINDAVVSSYNSSVWKPPNDFVHAIL